MLIISELRRRNVIRVAMAYVAVAWLVVQVLDTLAPLFGINDDVARIIVIVLGIGLIPALIFAWVLEWTSDGLKRDSEADHSAPGTRRAAKRLDQVIISILAIAVIYFAFDKFVLDPARDVDLATEAAEKGRDEALLDSFGDHSIAVMPFSDLSANQDQEYFSDGIAEEIINLLSRIRNLRVIARSSAFSFKGQKLAASVIAERLRVRYIMEGSVRRAGDRLRITATMIDASSDTQLWSENFDRDFGDIFAIQDEIAGEVVDRLEMQISGKLPVAKHVDPESYALYLQAKHLMTLGSDEGTVEADRLIGEAVALDPNNVEAWLLYTNVDYVKHYLGIWTLDEAIAHSREVTRIALGLDPSNPRALIVQRQLEQGSLDSWEGELASVAFALGLLPTDPATNARAASTLSILGFPELAIEYFDYVLAKDPMCVPCLRGYMFTLMQKGDLDGAMAANRRYVALTGGSGTYTRGILQLLQGDAVAALETIEMSGVPPFVLMQGRALAYRDLGRIEDYEAELAVLEAALDNEEFDAHMLRPEDFLAGLYSWVGRKDEAFAILDELIDPPNSWGPVRWTTDALFVPLHNDPRWEALLTKEGIGPEQIESFELEKLFPGPGLVPLK